MIDRCYICGKAEPGVCRECGDILLALAYLKDEQMIVRAELLLSAARAREERKEKCA
jgi:hypothetical protein